MELVNLTTTIGGHFGDWGKPSTNRTRIHESGQAEIVIWAILEVDPLLLIPPENGVIQPGELLVTLKLSHQKNQTPLRDCSRERGSKVICPEEGAAYLPTPKPGTGQLFSSAAARERMPQLPDWGPALLESRKT